MKKMIRTKEDLKDAVETYGFLPLFRNPIPGFSVAEQAAPSAWFSSEEGVWEWKGPVIRECRCAYGKFFLGKAVFISEAWYPDFANYRRDGYDFDARYEDGLASHRDLELYQLVERNGPMLSKGLKRLGGYGKEGKKGFDTGMTHLQEQGYVLISDFVYEQDQGGKPYGWGVAQYDIPERFFGQAFAKKVYQRKPEESRQRILEHLKKQFPEASALAWNRIIR